MQKCRIIIFYVPLSRVRNDVIITLAAIRSPVTEEIRKPAALVTLTSF